MNSAYKHLDNKLRLAELSIVQWLGVLLGVGLGIVWGMVVSPFGASLTLASSVYVAAVPIGAAVMSSLTEFDLWLLVRSAIAWRRLDGRFIAGGGQSAVGYEVYEDEDWSSLGADEDRSMSDLQWLWEEG